VVSTGGFRGLIGGGKSQVDVGPTRTGLNAAACNPVFADTGRWSAAEARQAARSDSTGDTARGGARDAIAHDVLKNGFDAALGSYT
jgi:hypothetical protein